MLKIDREKEILRRVGIGFEPTRKHDLWEKGVEMFGYQLPTRQDHVSWEVQGI
jgi:hypothetical protein